MVKTKLHFEDIYPSTKTLLKTFKFQCLKCGSNEIEVKSFSTRPVIDSYIHIEIHTFIVCSACGNTETI